MASLTIVLIAIALGMDAFAVAMSAGAYLVSVDGRQTFRMSFHFGLFQALMPLLGWLAGMQLLASISVFDHWLAFGLLVFIGGKMLHAAIRREESRIRADVTRGWSLVTLSVATSIDAFAVGLGLAVLDYGIVVASLVIGVVAAVMTVAGLKLGARLSARFGRRMEFLGGLILIGIGMRIVLEHLGII